MIITTIQAAANVEAARTAVGSAVTAGLSTDTLAQKVNDLAAAEGAYRVWSVVEGMQGSDTTRQEIMIALLDMLSNSADDTWSGRGNDVRRARADGMRTAVQDARWALARTQEV